MTEETLHRYHGLDDLLYAAFRTAATYGRSRSTLTLTGRGGGGEFTPLEVATEAVNIRGLALQVSGFMGSRIILAKYEYPCDKQTHRTEAEAIAKCAAYAIANNKNLKARFRYFVQDAIRDFCDKRMHHTYEWWAHHLSYSRRHVEFQWARRSAARLDDRSIHALMLRILAPAEERIAAALADRGVRWSA